ncbi:unnamed protein product, partial [Closterium sp. Naga37s-1]
QVLLDLQQAWRRNFSGWVAGGDCSLAHGVWCDAEGMVSAIRLYNVGLTGSIPDSISALYELTFFDVSSNNLTGRLPPTVGNLTLLYYFDVSSNNLTGRLPPTVGNLTLVILDISDTGITCPPDYSSCVVPQNTSSFFCRQCGSFCTTCVKPPP